MSILKGSPQDLGLSCEVEVVSSLDSVHGQNLAFNERAWHLVVIVHFHPSASCLRVVRPNSTLRWIRFRRLAVKRRHMHTSTSASLMENEVTTGIIKTRRCTFILLPFVFTESRTRREIDQYSRIPPLAVSRCIRAGKSRAMHEIALAVQARMKKAVDPADNVNVLMVGFHANISPLIVLT